MAAKEPNQAADTLPRLLLRRAAEHGDRVALRNKDLGIWQQISWSQYARQARTVANGLLSLGIRRGECVAIISENRPEWLYVDLGIQSIGAVTAAIYVTSVPEQVAYIVEHSQARVIFVEDEEQLDKVLQARDRLPELEQIVVLDWRGLRAFSDRMTTSYQDFMQAGKRFGSENPDLLDEQISKTAPEETALLVYTSGTTGPPKGAMLSHQNLIWTSHALSRTNPIDEDDEVLSFLPLCHIAERMMTTVNQLVLGYTVSFAESLDTVPQNLREVSPTVFFAVPRIWEKFHSRIQLTMEKAVWSKRLAYRLALGIGERVAGLFAAGKPIGAGLRLLHRLAHLLVFHPLRKRLGLERVRLAISGAAPIAPKILRTFHALGLKLREVYGQTEGCGPTTIHQGDEIRFGTVGRPLPGVEVKIAADGEILVRGPNVFLGYFRDEQATSATLVGGFLHSGDTGQFDKDGFLMITDRKKDLIITAGGKNVAPQNVENQLKASTYINDAVVIGEGRPYLVALVLIDEENVSHYAQQQRIPFTTYADLAHNPEVGQLIDGEVREANRALARFEQIKKFRVLDKRLEEEDGEITPTMKVKRKSVEQAYAGLVAAMYGD